MKITLLGTGSPEPSVRRASSGFLVEVAGDCILFDCGGGVFDRLIQSGRKPSDITHIFFTHLHSDHMMDYARLVHAAWDEGGRPIAVHGPAPLAKINEKLFGADGVFATDLIARTENPGSQEVWQSRGGSLPRPWPAPVITEIAPGFSHAENGWALTSAQAYHAQPQLESIAYRLDCDGRSFVYSGDTALCEEVETLARGTDLLVHWCYRLSGETVHPTITRLSPSPADAAAMAKRAGVGRLVLTHFRNHMDTADAHASARAELAEHFGGNALVGEDLMVFQL